MLAGGDSPVFFDNLQETFGYQKPLGLDRGRFVNAPRYPVALTLLCSFSKSKSPVDCPAEDRRPDITSPERADLSSDNCQPVPT